MRRVMGNCRGRVALRIYDFGRDVKEINDESPAVNGFGVLEGVAVFRMV